MWLQTLFMHKICRQSMMDNAQLADNPTRSRRLFSFFHSVLQNLTWDTCQQRPTWILCQHKRSVGEKIPVPECIIHYTFISMKYSHALFCTSEHISTENLRFRENDFDVASRNELQSTFNFLISALQNIKLLQFLTMTNLSISLYAQG